MHGAQRPQFRAGRLLARWVYSPLRAGTAATATKVFNASANTGLGNETVTFTFRLSMPAATSAGTYTSTWTYSLVSGP